MLSEIASVFLTSLSRHNQVRLKYTHKDLLDKVYKGNSKTLKRNLDSIRLPQLRAVSPKSLTVEWLPYGTSGVYIVEQQAKLAGERG